MIAIALVHRIYLAPVVTKRGRHGGGAAAPIFTSTETAEHQHLLNQAKTFGQNHSMSPGPICTVLDNPPEGFFDEEIIGNGSHVNQIIASSDSEDETANNGGYELLPQESDPEIEENGSGHYFAALDESEIQDEEPNISSQFQLFINQMNEDSSITSSELQEMSASSCPIECSPMEKEQIDQIKAAMVNVTLPNSAVPEWAKIVPEEEWKAALFASINSRLTTKKSTKDLS